MTDSNPPRPKGTSILQPWVAELGLRHQGALLGCIRGCDSVAKEDPSKNVVRMIRGVLLVTHCSDPAKAKSFIHTCDIVETDRRLSQFARSLDHYPVHWLFHLIHAIQIIGYCHPDGEVQTVYTQAYNNLCHKLHVNPETAFELHARLDANEEAFGAQQ